MEEEKKPGFAEPKRGRSRRRREEKKAAKLLKPGLAVAAAGALLLAAGIGGLLYWNEARRYESCFFPGTQINGMDVSKKTAGQVKAEILAGLSGYRLAIVGREGASGTLSGEDIGLHAEFDGSLEKMLDAQNPMEWWKHKDSAAENQRLETMVVYEEEKLQKALDGLDFLDEAVMKEPENARISDYIAEKKGYEILSAYPGTELIPKKVKEAVSDAVMGLSEELDLEEAGCYTKPAVEADDEGLLSLAAELNRYAGASVTHTFGEKEAVLDGDTIHQWLSIDGQTVTLDEGKVSEYVAELANTYDTAYKNKTLKTSYGPTVTISRGNYGWRMNKAAETAAVLEIIKNGEQKTREPEYTQTAASRGEKDYGDTYVEINLTAQHLYFYKEGKLLVESDFVSGNQSRGWSTPGGAYPLTYKQRNATLKGEGYSTPVSYWMPFNGGIGMHDASWRGSFGGSIYKTNGSHGCINLPVKAAKTIYENISAGMPVLCYHLEGTESKKSSSAPKETAPATTAPATTAPVPEATTPPTEAPGETLNPTPEGTTPGNPVGPGGETPGAPNSGEPQPSPSAPGETAPSQPTEPQPSPPAESSATVQPESPASPLDETPTAGGDEDNFGPGFTNGGQTPQSTEPPVGPGY